MSEIKLISPLLDNFAIGEIFSDHDGIRCCPAIDEKTENRYIIKVIPIPSFRRQLDALLLTGAYSSEEAAMEYFWELADGIRQEVQTLKELSALEGFFPFTDLQIVPMEDEAGYEVYLLSPYRKTLERRISKNVLTHLDAINLGLDLCAALSVCRRAGYLYANLKPENIYLTENKQYRIGDLGFLRLDSLKYQSLPDKYRSVYTAPEITDALSALNTTLDVYAIGMVLYQVFNGGILPFSLENKPTEALPAPAYSDFEMTQIILKACAPDPSQRWQDPVEMGQALVAYMQRNGAHETTIVPVPETVDAAAEMAEEKQAEISSLPEISYEEASKDIAEILAAADDLASHQIPAPAEILEAAEAKENEAPQEETAVDAETEASPEEIPPAQEEDTQTPAEDASADAPQEFSVQDAEDTPAETELEQPEEVAEETAAAVHEEVIPNTPILGEPKEESAPKKRKKHTLRNIMLIILLLGILGGAAYYYFSYYLQPIHAIVLDGSYDNLTVLVTTEIPEDKLTVICTDANGNQRTAPVVNGKAEFTGLTPNMGYDIRISIDGFYRLVGDTEASYSTPVLTHIPQFSIINGTAAGTVQLNFAVDGQDADKWTITYAASDEAAKTISFTGHSYTLSGLTVGKEYTFDLDAIGDLYITGSTHLIFTPQKPVTAENLSIISCANGKLNATWSVPAGTTVKSWTVRCYNGTDYDETIVVNGLSAEFTGLNCSDSFTVVVTAADMSINTSTSIPANSINVTDFKAEANKTGGIVLSWAVNQGTQPAGWILTYGIEGTEITDTLPCSGNLALISAAAPGETYWFSLQTAQGQTVLHTKLFFTTPAATDFTCTYKDGDESYTVGKENIVFSMCKTPKNPNWTKDDLSSSDFTNKFAPNEKASFLVQLSKPYGLSDEIIETLYVISDTSGNIVSICSTQSTWTNMWYKRYCELDIPALPAVSGEYAMNVYFNGMHVAAQDFTIS